MNARFHEAYIPSNHGMSFLKAIEAAWRYLSACSPQRPVRWNDLHVQVNDQVWRIVCHTPEMVDFFRAVGLTDHRVYGIHLILSDLFPTDSFDVYNPLTHDRVIIPIRSSP